MTGFAPLIRVRGIDDPAAWEEATAPVVLAADILAVACQPSVSPLLRNPPWVNRDVFHWPILTTLYISSGNTPTTTLIGDYVISTALVGDRVVSTTLVGDYG